MDLPPHVRDVRPTGGACGAGGVGAVRAARAMEPARGVVQDGVSVVGERDVVVVAPVRRARVAEIGALPVAFRVAPAVHHHQQRVATGRRGGGGQSEVDIQRHAVEAGHEAGAHPVGEGIGRIGAGLARGEQGHRGLRRRRSRSQRGGRDRAGHHGDAMPPGHRQLIRADVGDYPNQQRPASA